MKLLPCNTTCTTAMSIVVPRFLEISNYTRPTRLGAYWFLGGLWAGLRSWIPITTVDQELKCALMNYHSCFSPSTVCVEM